MSTKTKIRKIGNSYGIILPKETLNALQVKEGDTLYITEAPDRKVNLYPESEPLDGKMQIVMELMDRYKNALQELAK